MSTDPLALPTCAESDRDAATDEIDPLALALFGIRDHIRHHHGCADRRGIGGHHFNEADECALADIILRYGDVRAGVVDAKLTAARSALAAFREVRQTQIERDGRA